MENLENCDFCKESLLDVGDKTKYGAVIIYKAGNKKNGWFAALSPRTGGDPEKDFSIQLMPCSHLKFFSDIDSDENLAKNYGIIFAKLNMAAGKIINDESDDKTRIPLASYAKCKHPDEHIHLKIFPYRGVIGQPFTVDSSFEKKNIFYDNEDKEGFVKMKPVKKTNLPEKRFIQLAEKLIKSLNK